MSAAAVIYSLLSADATLVGLVGDRIYPERVPEGVRLSAVSYRTISRTQADPVSLSANVVTVTARIEVTCQVVAGDFPGLAALISAVHDACVNRRGTIAGVPFVVVRDAGQGPQLRDEERQISSQTHDFLVTHHSTP